MMQVCARVKRSGAAGRTGKPVGKDLAEMDEVSYFTLRRRRAGEREREKKMGQDPNLRLPPVAQRRILRKVCALQRDGVASLCSTTFALKCTTF